MKDYFCGIADKPQDAKPCDFVYKSRASSHRGLDVPLTTPRTSRSVGDAIVTPLQFARAYGALADGGTLGTAVARRSSGPGAR